MTCNSDRKNNQLGTNKDIRAAKWKVSDGVMEKTTRGKIAKGKGRVVDHERN